MMGLVSWMYSSVSSWSHRTVVRWLSTIWIRILLSKSRPIPLHSYLLVAVSGAQIEAMNPYPIFGAYYRCNYKKGGFCKQKSGRTKDEKTPSYSTEYIHINNISVNSTL